MSWSNGQCLRPSSGTWSRRERTSSLIGPDPWTSQLTLKGPPRPAATDSMPVRVGERFQTAVGKAGWCTVSATVGMPAGKVALLSG